MSKLFDGNHRSVKLVESDEGQLDVTIIMPKFVFDELLLHTQPNYIWQCSWESTDIEKIKLFIPTPVQRPGQTSHGNLAATKAFGMAVDHAQKQVAKMLELSKAGGSLEDVWVLAPEQWMYHVWRLETTADTIGYFVSKLERISENEDSLGLSAQCVEFCLWIIEEIKKWIAENAE